MIRLHSYPLNDQQKHFATYGWIIRRLISYVAKLNQILHTLMIGRQSADLSHFHKRQRW